MGSMALLRLNSGSGGLPARSARVGHLGGVRHVSSTRCAVPSARLRVLQRA